MLPEQVRKRAELANQLVAELNGPKPGEPTPQGQAPSDPPVDPPNPDPAPAPVAPPQPPVAATPVAPPEDPNGDSWKHKYQTLQGVLQAETSRRDALLRSQGERLTELEHQLATATKPPAPPPAAPAPQYSQDEIDRFGPELLQLISSKAAAQANEIVTRKMAEFAPRIEQMQSQVQAVGQSVYEDKEAEFWGELKRDVADFEALNTSVGFLTWLGQEDDVSGVQRQAILDQAAKRLDHRRVVKLFNAYKTSAGIPVTGAQTVVSAPAPAAPPVSPSPRTVGTGGSGPTPREPEAPTVKRSEIAAHYRRSTTDPTYRPSPEYAAMEQRISQATAANRVLNA